MKRIAKLFITIFNKFKNLSKCRFDVFSNIVIKDCKFEGKNALGVNNYLSNVIFGVGSFIGYGCELSNTLIGKYTSIGNNLRVVSATHPTEKTSTFPAFYSDSFYLSYNKDKSFVEHLSTDKGYDCEIGNDVWIGDNVLIKGGVKIGNGSIIGMGSIVLKDVPPYSIVAGCPARIIRMRFSDDIILKLENLKWWNMTEDNIKKYAKYFNSPEELLGAVEDRNLTRGVENE